MAVLKHVYLEAHDPSENKHAFYLPLLLQEGSTFKALAYYGRIGHAHQVTSKANGTSRSAAEAAYNKVVWEKENKRGEVSYGPKPEPAWVTQEIAKLNKISANLPGPPAPTPAANPRTTTPAAPKVPAGPAAPFPLPEFVPARAVDATTYAAALASPAYVATPTGGDKVFVVIPVKGRAQIVAPDRFPQPDSLNRFPTLVSSLDPANPILTDSVFAGEALGRGTNLQLWDILVYRGNDVRGFPLSERLSLLYQAFNELAREGQLNVSWSLADCLGGPEKKALIAKGTPVVLRGLGAAYSTADPTAAIRR